MTSTGFLECPETKLFSATVSESGTMACTLECCLAIGWGATLMIRFLTSVLGSLCCGFCFHSTWMYNNLPQLGGLDCFALWIILQNNWGTQKSSNNCVSSSFPLLNLQKYAPTHTFTQVVQTSLFSLFLVFLPYIMKIRKDEVEVCAWVEHEQKFKKFQNPSFPSRNWL
jgi:hypothetical protein